MKTKSSTKKHKIMGIIGLIISIIFLWLSFRGTNWSDFIRSSQNVNYSLLIGAMAVLIGSVWVRAIRWKYLLSSVGEASNEALYKATMVGYMGNNILPFKMGELLRAYAISRRTNIIFSGAFSSVIIERIVDIISFLLIITIIFSIYPITELTQTIAIIGFFTIIVFLLISFILFKNDKKFLEWYLSKQQHLIEENKETIAKYLVGFCQGIEGLWKNPKPFLTFILSLFLWGIYFIFTFFCISAFNFPINLAEMLKMTLLVLTFTTLVVLIPSAPGTLGTYQAATIAALQIISVNIDTARAFAVISYLVQYFPLTMIGLFYFFQLKLHIIDLDEVMS